MGVRLAGEGAFTPLVVRLTREFSDRNPGEALVVEAAVGGRGAQRALADGVLDAAIVARSVGQPLAAGGVRVAGTEVVLAAGRGTGLRGRLSPERLAGLLSAEVPGKLRLFLRGPEDALEQALVASAPLLGPSFEGALQTQRWPVLTDESGPARDAARGAGSGGAGGYRVPGAARAAGVDGAGGGAAAAGGAGGGGPGPDAPPRLTQFLAWVAGPEGQALVQELGYRPITGAP
jgi:hypothetical protein